MIDGPRVPISVHLWAQGRDILHGNAPTRAANVPMGIYIYVS